jgi:CheY-like chemotaxis protein
MNGTITIESKKNIGTSFQIQLNLKRGSFNNIKDLYTKKEYKKIDGVKILLVEDNYMNRMVAQNSLQYFNCKVTEAENGIEALEILKSQNFDIILMDIQMPEMDGIEATKIIRNEFKLKTPIIALTANAFKTEIKNCKKVGMNDYVTKPFEESVLIETISKNLNNIANKNETQKIDDLNTWSDKEKYFLRKHEFPTDSKTDCRS